MRSSSRFVADLRLLPLALALACEGAETPDEVPPAEDLGVCDGEGGELTLLARALTFERIEGGVSDGFDLDGYATEQGDDEGCGVADLVGPDGASGIDNSVAGLLPILDLTEAVVLEDLVADSIRNGALLLMASLTDVDDLTNDTCVDVSIHKGVGVPMVGNDNELLPWQTFATDPSVQADVVTGSLADGVWEVGPIGFVGLPITVLDLSTTLELYDAWIRVEEGEDGVWRGVLGGGITVEQLTYVATLANVSDDIYALLAPALGRLADLAPDENGVCTRMSVTLNLEMIPAYRYAGGAE